VAPASDVAGHVEDILCGKCQASKRSMRGPSKVRIGIVTKSVYMVIQPLPCGGHGLTPGVLGYMGEQQPKSGHTTLEPHARAAGHTPSPRRGGRLGWGGECRRRAASLFTPTLALPRLRGRGIYVPTSWGLI